ncbi:hypothetical protein CEE45_09635 [Candidatus Heimdallarchaeota archaeon B3_Heim]|nr:MAG: hypothetical protein CEE45_09635 [Candidatus Heimdallarchaeota archaeon B3_Heim]
MFEIVVELLGIIVLVAGLIGVAYGLNKFTKSKGHESGFLKFLALATSIVIGIVNILAIYEGFIVHVGPDEIVNWLTVVLIFLAGMSMLADPLKETPLAAIISMITLGALAGLLLLFAEIEEGGSTDINLFDIITLPMWLVILGIVVIVGIVFVASFFTEFTVDRILQLISWSPIIIVFSALLLIQGLLMLVLEEPAGIWHILNP